MVIQHEKTTIKVKINTLECNKNKSQYKISFMKFDPNIILLRLIIGTNRLHVFFSFSNSETRVRTAGQEVEESE